MKIIDSHTHTKTEECNELIEYSKKFGILKCFLLGDVLKYGYNQNEEQVKEINELTIKLINKYPDFLGFLLFKSEKFKKIHKRRS